MLKYFLFILLNLIFNWNIQANEPIEFCEIHFKVGSYATTDPVKDQFPGIDPDLAQEILNFMQAADTLGLFKPSDLNLLISRRAHSEPLAQHEADLWNTVLYLASTHPIDTGENRFDFFVRTYSAAYSNSNFPRGDLEIAAVENLAKGLESTIPPHLMSDFGLNFSSPEFRSSFLDTGILLQRDDIIAYNENDKETWSQYLPYFALSTGLFTHLDHSFDFDRVRTTVENFTHHRNLVLSRKITRVAFLNFVNEKLRSQKGLEELAHFSKEIMQYVEVLGQAWGLDAPQFSTPKNQSSKNQREENFIGFKRLLDFAKNHPGTEAADGILETATQNFFMSIMTLFDAFEKDPSFSSGVITTESELEELLDNTFSRINGVTSTYFRSLEELFFYAVDGRPLQRIDELTIRKKALSRLKSCFTPWVSELSQTARAQRKSAGSNVTTTASSVSLAAQQPIVREDISTPIIADLFTPLPQRSENKRKPGNQKAAKLKTKTPRRNELQSNLPLEVTGMRTDEIYSVTFNRVNPQRPLAQGQHFLQLSDKVLNGFKTDQNLNWQLWRATFSNGLAVRSHGANGMKFIGEKADGKELYSLKRTTSNFRILVVYDLDTRVWYFEDYFDHDSFDRLYRPYR